MKVYFDVCCLNRPFDDQTQNRVRLETAAILLILSRIESGELQWLSSPAIVAEVRQTPDKARRSKVLQLLEQVDESVTITNEVKIRTKILESIGFKPFDALHLACSEEGQASIFLTTDDKLLSLASRLAKQIDVEVDNPLAWIQE